jgi:hypothetical protein
MNKVLLLAATLFFLSGLSKVNAQYNLPENSVWAFGDHRGMDFSGANPVPVNTSMFHGEGCASVCDGEGALLFYSNGNKVWDAAGNLFPHGQNLDIPVMTALTTTQTALIVPIPAQMDKYYLFTLGTKLYCYRIDMSLNNGVGDIDTTFALTHVALKDSLAEKMIAVRGCHNDIWVVVKPYYTAQFYSFNITTQGVNTVPIISTAGFSLPADYFQRTMTASPDGNKIAVNTNTRLELLNFDKTNGKVSNGKVIDNEIFYGSCFSPNGKLLFGNKGGIYQYNLEDCNPAATKVNLGYGFFGDIKLAPNGKIYFRSQVGPINAYSFLGSIEHPDVVGAGCQFRDSVSGTGMLILDPNSAANYSLGLTNTVVKANMDGEPINRKYFDTCICKFPYNTGLTLTAASGFSNYLWSDGSTTATSLNIHQRGTYWVSYKTSCGGRIDTFTVRGDIEPVSLVYNVPLIATSGTYQSYKWYKDGVLITGAINPTFSPATSGVYSVVVENDKACTDSAFIDIVVTPTGIGEHDNIIKVSVYPNPATDMIYIESASRLQALITDLSGRVLIEARHGKTFDISKLQNGAYFIKIMNNTGELVTVKKFIKMNK